MRAARAMATTTRWWATKRAIRSIIFNINMCITMIINVHEEEKRKFRGGVLQHMPLLLLDKYSQTKHTGHCPCMWEDTNNLCLIAAAA